MRLALVQPSSRRIVVNENDRVGKWVAAHAGFTYSPTNSQCFGYERDGEIVAGVIFDNYRVHSIGVHIAGEGRYWMTREGIHACCDYPFRQLGVHKIIGYIDEANVKSRNIAERLGFTLEARITGAAKSGGDLLIFTMTQEQCKWLR